jgi:hypothetical protein
MNEYLIKGWKAIMAQISDLSVQYITNESGEKISVVLPIEKYQRMLEDLHDLAIIAERKDEGAISLSEIKKQFLPV